MARTITLYRPVGPEELRLIRDSGWRRFPPRLPEQTIFYPVIQMEYAERIACEWNVKESGAGFVTRFSVSLAYLSGFDAHEVGGRQCTEYWIPAEQLSEFNEHIEGFITVVKEFRTPDDERAKHPDKWITIYDLREDREAVRLARRATHETEDFGLEVEIALFGSVEWWQAVEDGRIASGEIQGRVSRTYMSGHGDWPVFELDSDGARSQWTRMGSEKFYKVGNQIRIEYVIQKARRHWISSREQKVVCRILCRA